MLDYKLTEYLITYSIWLLGNTEHRTHFIRIYWRSYRWLRKWDSHCFNEYWHLQSFRICETWNFNIGIKIKALSSLFYWEKLYQNYLLDREHQVSWNKQSFSNSPLNTGVSERSSLGHLLFLIYINNCKKFLWYNYEYG